MDPVTAVAIIWAPTMLLGYWYYIQYRKQPETPPDYSPLNYLDAVIVGPLLGPVLVLYLLKFQRMPHEEYTPQGGPPRQARLNQFPGRTAATATGSKPGTADEDEEDRELTLDLDTDSVYPDDRVRDE